MLPTVAPGVVVWHARGGIDAIDQYSERLIGALRAVGQEARYFRAGLSPVLNDSRMPPWVLIQYNPFRYGRFGCAPWLLRDAIRLRCRNVPLAIMVHEAWVPMTGWRTALMGVWQRAQLRLLMRLSGYVMASTEALARELGHGAVHNPVASNITPVPTSPEAARDELGLPPALVVTVFGRAHESRALDVAASAIAAIAAARGDANTIVLNLGADAPALGLPAHLDVRNPGPASERELSLHLLASDLVLLPFTDGVSTRRGTLMASLAHGRAVIGSRGRNTDAVLVAHPEALALAPVGDLDAYVDAAVALAADCSRRQAMAEAGRRLYDRSFDWPLVAARVIAALDAITARRGRARR